MRQRPRRGHPAPTRAAFTLRHPASSNENSIRSSSPCCFSAAFRRAKAVCCFSTLGGFGDLRFQLFNPGIPLSQLRLIRFRVNAACTSGISFRALGMLALHFLLLARLLLRRLLLFGGMAASDAGNAGIAAVCAYFWVVWPIGGIACAITSLAMKAAADK